jgi:hypothetical protein
LTSQSKKPKPKPTANSAFSQFPRTFLKCVLPTHKGLVFEGFVEEIEINSHAGRHIPVGKDEFVDVELTGEPVKIHMNTDPNKILMYVKGNKLVNAESFKMDLHVKRVTSCIIAVIGLPTFKKTPPQKFIFR